MTSTPSPFVSENKLRRMLKLVIVEGGFYFVMVGFGEAFFLPFALWLGATPLQVGILSTLPLFLGALSQVFSSRLIAYFKSRRLFIVFAVVVQALTFIPMGLSPFFPLPIAFFTAFVSLYHVAILIHVPAWNSWVADLVHESHRGEYFGFHKRMTQVVVFVATLASGPLLGWLVETLGSRHAGFAVLFGLALVARLTSASLLRRIWEPKLEVEGLEKLNWRGELKKIHRNHLSRLILILAILGFASYFSSPFYTPYLLNQLNWDYPTYSLYLAIVIAARFLFSPVWGKLCDDYGCRSILVVTSFGISTVPFYWLLTDNALVLCALQVLAGLFWCGYELSWFNFMMDSTTRTNRAQFFSLQQVLGNLSLVLGSLCGGAVITMLGETKFSYHYVFVISGILRFLASLGIIFFIHEIRIVQKVPYRAFASVFYKAVKDRGVFYVPEILRAKRNRPETE